MARDYRKDLDYRDEFDLVEEQFPWLHRALSSTHALFSETKRLRNKGLANDQDVEAARQARQLLLNILDAGNWRWDTDADRR